MNDDFLYRNRPPVRKEFVQALKQRLMKEYPDSFHMRKRKNSGKIKRSWGMAFLTILLFFSFLFIFPNEVRANVMNWIQSVAGFQVEHLDTPPTIGEGEVLNSSNDQKADHNNLPVTDSTPTATVMQVTPTVYVVPTVSSETLLQNLPFAFELPRFVPEGFVLNDSAAFANSSDWVLLTWNKTNAEVALLVERTYTGYYLPAGPEKAEEVQVNEQPALLIRGWWDPEQNWDPIRKVELHWQHNERYYRLIYTQRSKTRWEIEPITSDIQNVVEDLIRMAESIP